MTSTTTGVRGGPGLWGLERLRLWRTRRWIALVAVYLLLGFGEPLITRYLGQLLGRSVGDSYIQITVSAPKPRDAMQAYFSNITTLGTLVVVVVAGLAFAIRTTPPLAAIYFTHVPNRPRLLLPRLGTVAVASAVAAALGGLAAIYETTLLIGAPAGGASAAGVALSCGAVVFAVAVTFAASTLLRGQVGSIAVALATLFVVVPAADLIPGVRRVGPNAFTNLPVTLQTTGWSTDDTWAVVVTGVLTVGCVALGLWRSTRWEL
jgi:ABC-2 type transport system permease protein